MSIKDRLKEGFEMTIWQIRQKVVGSIDRSTCFVEVTSGIFINS